MTITNRSSSMAVTGRGNRRPAAVLRLAVAVLILVMLVTGVLIDVTDVHAIADPSTPPQVRAVYCYENAYTDGDLGVLVDIYIDYAVIPDETVTESYLVIFVDKDGTTQLKSVAPYTFQNSGYGHNLVWLYFTPSEVTAYNLSSDYQSDYKVWLTGNPTVPSGWTSDPPLTVGTVTQWTTVEEPELVIASQILYYADQLELEWSLDMIEETAVGSALTTTGVSYFTNVITNLRTIAPGVFSSREIESEYVPISYNTAFGATASSGSATVSGSPVTLSEGSNTITVSSTGTIVIDLAGWTYGTITNGTGVVTGSPVNLTPGTNTLTITTAGTFTVDLEVRDSITLAEKSVEGTMFDLSELAATFGMSRWWFSGLVWFIVVVILCAATYRVADTPGDGFSLNNGASKAVMIVFTIGVIGGTLLGMLKPVVAAFMIIACGAWIGYVLFYTSDALHKGVMFMIWMFLITSVAGNIVAGQMPIAATRLEADLSSTETDTITVASTDGFPDSGKIVIGDEVIAYPSKTDTAFVSTSVLGITINPILRGEDGTEAADHTAGATVRTLEASFLNAALDYRIARIADTAGFMDFITLPFRLIQLLGQFFTLPLDFLGTDMALLTYVWGVVAIGMIVGLAMAVLGGRRV